MMTNGAFGFDNYSGERRRLTGRRKRDRRVLPDRRVAERRIQLVAVAVNRRNGNDRRVRGRRWVGSDRRHVADRRANWYGSAAR